MKWGFLGYGKIARKFEESLGHTDHRIHAIASRSGYGEVPKHIKSYKNYDELLNDEDVDIVYVNTTHNSHAVHTIAALNAGKHVLCEKPMGISYKEVKEMIDAAKSNRCFLMEAVWTRFLPGYQKVKSIINKGTLGEIKSINAQFGFKMNPDDPKERLIDPKLAAGAVWDVGIYPISLAQDLFGESPIKIDVSATLSSMGIENRCAMQFTYSNNKTAQLSCAVDLNTPNLALISGSEGYIIMTDFWKCETFKVVTSEGSDSYHLPMTSTGLYHEAIACASYIQQGILESPLMTWQNSLQLSAIMDEVISMARNE